MNIPIDWKKCYNHLIEIKEKFRDELFNSVLINFYPLGAKIESKEKNSLFYISFKVDQLKQTDYEKMIYSKKNFKEIIKDAKRTGKIFSEDFLSFCLENFPPHFSFGMGSDFDSCSEKRKNLDKVLDEVAKQNGLRHNRGKYEYNHFKAQNKKGGWYNFTSPGVYLKSPASHVFKPDYSKFAI